MEKIIGNIMIEVINENRDFINISSCDKTIKEILCKSISNDVVKENLRLILNDDIDLFGHNVRTAIISIMIGSHMNLSEEQLIKLGSGAILHDIGKIFISKSILNKKGKLSPQEFAEVKKHPKLGYNFIKDSELDECSKLIILEHHERADGAGYPNNAKAIHPLSKIVSIADTYDAITSSRSYKDELSPATALNIIYENINTQFDKFVAGSFCMDMSFMMFEPIA